MSHVTKLSGIKITSVTALTKAVDELKQKGIECSLVQNQKPRVHGADAAPMCEHVLKLKGAYDVGFQKQADGSFTPVYDTYQSHVGKQIGATCPMPTTAAGRTQHQMGQLLQGYAKHAAIEQANAQGYYVEQSSVDAEGNVHLTLGGM
jgi:hypothetical protein